MFWDGNGQSQRERVLSADYVFSATLPSAVPCRHHNGHLREMRREVVTDELEVVRAVVRAEAILVASRSLSPLERQPQPERQPLCTWPGEFPSCGLCSVHHHHATLKFRTMISGVFVNSLYPPACCVGRCGKSQCECWRQHGRKHEDHFDSLRHDIGRGRLPCYLVLASTLWAACRFHFESLWHAWFVLLLVRPSCQYQGSQIGLPRTSVVALFFVCGSSSSQILCRVFMCCFTGHYTSFFG